MSANRKPKERPWYPRHVDAFNTDDKVIGMTWAERGFYDFLLDAQWKHGSIPADRVRLARWAKMPLDVFEATFGDMVNLCFAPMTDDPTRLQNSKMERVRAEQDAISEAQRKRVNNRYQSGSAPVDERCESGSLNLKSETLPSEEKLEILPLPGKPNAATRKTVDRWRAQAEEILAALNAARKRVHPASRGISPSYDSLSHIAGRLEAGKSAADCLHVVAVCEAECRARPDAFQWFDAVTPFVAKNFERKCAADPAVVGGQVPAQTAPKSEDTRPRPKPYEKRYADDLGEP